MKKFFKSIVIIFIVFFTLNFFKNLYSHIRYTFTEGHIYKIDGKSNGLIGSWYGQNDFLFSETWQHSIWKYHFDTDTTGEFSETYYSPRIDGRFAYPYTWRDLLPYKEPPYVISGKIIDVDSIYIVFTIEEGQKDDSSGILYKKYVKRGDMIILDRVYGSIPYSKPFNSNLLEKCGKATFWELLYVL